MSKRVFVLLSVMISMVMVLGFAEEQVKSYKNLLPETEKIKLDDIEKGYVLNDVAKKVLFIEDYDLDECLNINNFNQYAFKDILNKGAIIVWFNKGQASEEFEKILGVRVFEDKELNGSSLLKKNAGHGKRPKGVKVMSLYYKTGEKLNVDRVAMDNVSDLTKKVVLENIKLARESIKVNKSSNLDDRRRVFGEFETDNYRRYYPPKAKIYHSYSFSSIQDFNGLDYYIVKASIKAEPGVAIRELKSGGWKKYDNYVQEGMVVEMGSHDSGVRAETLEPRLNNFGNGWYIADLSRGIRGIKNAKFDIKLPLYYLTGVSNSDFSEHKSGGLGIWRAVYDDNWEKSITHLEPAVVLSVPQARDNIDVFCDIKYIVDKWGIFEWDSVVRVKKEFKLYPAGYLSK